MSTSLTSRLGLIKPNPGTGEAVNIATHLNANWDKIDNTIGATAGTSTARPSAPFDGQIVRESDTRRAYVWNATQGTWDQLFVNNGTGTFSAAGNVTVSGSLTANGSLVANGSLTASGGLTANSLAVSGNNITGSSNGISGFVGTGTFTNAAATGVYASIPSPSSFTISKKLAATRLKVSIGFTAFSSGTSTGIGFGAQIGGTDYDVVQSYFTVANQYQQFFGSAYISGIGAGTQTLQARWKRTAGSGVLTGINIISWLCFNAEEVS